MTASVFVAGKLLPETMEALSKWDVKAFSGEENITEAELIKKCNGSGCDYLPAFFPNFGKSIGIGKKS